MKKEYTYTYDATGVIGFEYNSTQYYYLKNAQGDVIGIADSSGNVVTEYSYDAWGKQLSVTGTLASTIGEVNPIRYRGYYYDSETGLYYLMSRYYDPENGNYKSYRSQPIELDARYFARFLLD